MPSTSTPSTLILLGGGGHASVVADAATSTGMTIVGFADDDPVAALSGLPHLGSISAGLSQAIAEGHAVHLAVGDNQLRATWRGQSGHAHLVSIRHATAVVSASALIEPGVFIGSLAVVNARSSIGRASIINSGAIVEHDSLVGPFSHVAPGAVLGGNSRIGERSLIGLNSTVLPGIEIGSGAILGAGAVATTDVPDNCTAVGCPARVMSTVG